MFNLWILFGCVKNDGKNIILILDFSTKVQIF